MKLRLMVTFISAFTFFASQHVFLSSGHSAALYVESNDSNVIVFPAYTGIQAAVDAADPGDTIYIPDGTYTENVVVDKPLTIKSVNGAKVTTVVAADPDDHVFNITADHVTLSGFTVYGATGKDKAGIRLFYAESCTITDNRCGVSDSSFNYLGIWLYEAGGSTISKNSCKYNEGYGIVLSFFSDALPSAQGNTLSENDCRYNGTGISLQKSGGNFIIDNYLLDNGLGISISGSDKNTVHGNSCFGGSVGIKVAGKTGFTSTVNRIIENRCDNNSLNGIRVETSNSNVFAGNTISNSGMWGILTTGSLDNTFYLNNLKSSTRENVTTGGDSDDFWSSRSTIWYTYEGNASKQSMGNYYDDHVFSDGDNDGITDASYSIQTGEKEDDYPLVKPSSDSSWGWNILCDQVETIPAGDSLQVLSALTISGGLITVDGGFLTIGGFW